MTWSRRVVIVEGRPPGIPLTREAQQVALRLHREAGGRGERAGELEGAVRGRAAGALLQAAFKDGEERGEFGAADIAEERQHVVDLLIATPECLVTAKGAALRDEAAERLQGGLPLPQRVESRYERSVGHLVRDRL